MPSETLLWNRGERPKRSGKQENLRRKESSVHKNEKEVYGKKAWMGDSWSHLVSILGQRTSASQPCGNCRSVSLNADMNTITHKCQIERRIAPFWKGLNDHEDTWTEHQLVAVVNGLPLPAADEIPPEEPPRPSKLLSPTWTSQGSEANLNNLTVPIGSRSMSANSDRPDNLSPSHPTFSLPSPTSPIANNSSSSPFFRGRAKTLASLASGSRNASQIDMAPQELNLPKDPYVNGQRVEAFLYKNASECPICFMYYPPYLNKTRCCDQAICSECFVQIKRPDPHPPEHHGDAESPPPEPQEEIQLVSEPAACPFCVQPEFGVTYEPPPFRRGLIYNGQGTNMMNSAASAMSSTSSLNSQSVTSPGRRRATSLAVNDKTVITTDMVRPDWAKKLADAKAHALRRAAAATALHNAAYMIGNIQQQESRFGLGRRRRTMFGVETTISSGAGTPRRDGEGSSSRGGEGSNDLFPGRGSSRRGNRLEDLEELMMMEAIRLSLAAEEERKQKEEKEAAKEAKKEGKKKAKENKKVAKAQRKIGSGFHPIDIDGLEDMDASSSSIAGKGKAVDRSDSASTGNTSTSKDDPQKYLEESRAQIARETSNTSSLAPASSHHDQSSHRSALRPISNGSSSASSFVESYQNSLREESQDNSNLLDQPSPNPSGLSAGSTPLGTPNTEPMFNFQSLTNAITAEEDKSEKETHRTEDIAAWGHAKQSSTHLGVEPLEPLAESVATIKPAQPNPTLAVTDDDEINAAPRIQAVSHEDSFDQKHLGDLRMVDGISHQHATQ